MNECKYIYQEEMKLNIKNQLGKLGKGVVPILCEVKKGVFVGTLVFNVPLELFEQGGDDEE